MHETFTSILRDHLSHLDPGQELDPGASLKELGLDSLRAVSLILELEDTFAVTLPDTTLTAETFETPASLWAAIERVTEQATSRTA